jgi:hypothetical protein
MASFAESAAVERAEAEAEAERDAVAADQSWTDYVLALPRSEGVQTFMHSIDDWILRPFVQVRVCASQVCACIAVRGRQDARWPPVQSAAHHRRRRRGCSSLCARRAVMRSRPDRVRASLCCALVLFR